MAILLERKKWRWVLTGLMVCDRCGKKFIGAAAKGNKYRYPYYVCFSRHRYGTQECPQDRLRAEEIEEKLVQSLVATLNRSDLIEEAVTRCCAARKRQAQTGKRS
jgi:site-specific DNA recombinase